MIPVIAWRPDYYNLAALEWNVSCFVVFILSSALVSVSSILKFLPALSPSHDGPVS
jgi:hypothetical protein